MNSKKEWEVAFTPKKEQEKVKPKITYTKVGYGYASKHPQYDPNAKFPMFTGPVTVNDEKLSIALWRQTKYGKESFSIQFTREDES
tara:strand:- start:591 stop:848 length:258 start_codon:yes stop_codon:yes gene_type:complete